jgi:hypothetical protein
MRWGWMLLISVWNSASGQFYFYDDKYLDQPVLIDVGVNFGLMSCLTDLGYGNKLGKGSEWTKGRYCIESGLFISVKWHQRVGIRFNVNYGNVTAADSVLKNAGDKAVFRYQRNLHFRSRIIESALVAVVHPIGFFQFESPPALQPYVFAGFGLFHFDPQAFLVGKWIPLAPLRSEGREPATFYNRWQSNLQAGIGGSYEMSARISIMFECAYRMLHTDYLDDISTVFIDPSFAEPGSEQAGQLKALYALSTLRPGPDVCVPGGIRGNSSNNDSYFSFRFAFGWTINRKRIH